MQSEIPNPGNTGHADSHRKTLLNGKLHGNADILFWVIGMGNSA